MIEKKTQNALRDYLVAYVALRAAEGTMEQEEPEIFGEAEDDWIPVAEPSETLKRVLIARAREVRAALRFIDLEEPLAPLEKKPRNVGPCEHLPMMLFNPPNPELEPAVEWCQNCGAIRFIRRGRDGAKPELWRVPSTRRGVRIP